MEEIIFPKWQYATQEQKDFVKHMYVDEKKSGEHISKLIGRDRKTVDNWLRYMNIPHRSISESNFITKRNNFNLTKTQMSVIQGELLGDGSLMAYKENIRHDYYFTVCSISKEHLVYLREQLPRILFCDNVPWFSPQKPRTRNGKILNEKDLWVMKSRSCSLLTKLREKWYPNRIKIVPKDLQLNPIMCFYWYIGDGTLVNRHYQRDNPCIYLSTHGFSEDDNDFLVNQLSDNGLKSTKQCAHDKNAFFIRISTSSTPDFLRWIGPPKISDYKYKWEAKVWNNYVKP